MSNSAIPLREMLEVVAAWRTDEVLIPSMGSAREWFKREQHPLDLYYIPSAMGQVATLGLGIALAQPSRHIVAMIGDGSLLMNLGCLATIAAAGAKNLTVLLLDNGVYEVTGSQKTAGSVVEIDYLAIARASGIEHTATYDSLTTWQAEIQSAMAMPGPKIIRLVMEPVLHDHHLPTPAPMPPRIAALQQALGLTPNLLPRRSSKTLVPSSKDLGGAE